MGYERLKSKRKQVLANRERSRLKEEKYTDSNNKRSLLGKIWDWIK